MRMRVKVFVSAGVVALVVALAAATTVAAQDGGRIGAAAQTPDSTSIHGSACQPANLGQSIAFGTSWATGGVINPNELGSGRSFFVVCPVVASADDGDANVAGDVWIQMRYLDRDTARRISCTATRTAVFNGTGGFITRQVTAIDTAVGTGPFVGVLILNDVVLETDATWLANDESVGVVCALPPKASISGVAFDKNDVP